MKKNKNFGEIVEHQLNWNERIANSYKQSFKSLNRKLRNFETDLNNFKVEVTKNQEKVIF